MQVEATLIGQPAESVNADCDLTGFYIELENDTSSLRIYIGDEHIEKLVGIFREWGYVPEKES